MKPEMMLDLEKSFELNLEKAGIHDIPALECKLAIDGSTSMMREYNSGWVDQAVKRFVAAALKFDDNGELEVGFFNTKFRATHNATAANVDTYLKDAKGRADGGTSFAPILEAFATPPKKGGFLGKLFGGGSKTPEFRAYIGVITDGDNMDHDEFERRLHDTNGDQFIQFIGIGRDVNSKYLNKIASRYEHVGFVELENPYEVSPDQFYEALCNPKFVAWANK